MKPLLLDFGIVESGRIIDLAPYADLSFELLSNLPGVIFLMLEDVEMFLLKAKP